MVVRAPAATLEVAQRHGKSWWWERQWWRFPSVEATVARRVATLVARRRHGGSAATWALPPILLATVAMGRGGARTSQPVRGGPHPSCGCKSSSYGELLPALSLFAHPSLACNLTILACCICNYVFFCRLTTGLMLVHALCLRKCPNEFEDPRRLSITPSIRFSVVCADQ